MANPLTSKPKKLSVLIQCVTRTATECRGELRLSDTETASRGSCAEAAVTIAAIIARMCGKQKSGERDEFCGQYTSEVLHIAESAYRTSDSSRQHRTPGIRRSRTMPD